MNHKLRRLLENCLCSGRRQTLFFLSFLSSASHQQASDGLPAKKRRQQARARAHPPRVRRRHQANAADASVRGGTAAPFA